MFLLVVKYDTGVEVAVPDDAQVSMKTDGVYAYFAFVEDPAKESLCTTSFVTSCVPCPQEKTEHEFSLFKSSEFAEVTETVYLIQTLEAEPQ